MMVLLILWYSSQLIISLMFNDADALNLFW